MDPDVGVLQGFSGPPPAPIHSGHLHHDGRTGRALPALSNAGAANPRGISFFPGGLIHPGGQRDCLGGSQAFPEPLGRPAGIESGTSPPVVDFCHAGRLT